VPKSPPAEAVPTASSRTRRGPADLPARTEGPAGPGGGERLACPDDAPLRTRIRGLAAALVASWRDGVPPDVRGAVGLRRRALDIVEAAGGRDEHVGWTMVSIVSEHWRTRLGGASEGRRLLLLPDCPAAPAVADSAMPRTCGPGCTVTRLWSAARQHGWVVEPTSRAVPAIGALLTGQYDGILGVAKLSHLEKAFGMLPAFALPIAAVPFDPDAAASVAGAGCGPAFEAATLDADWVLGFLGASVAPASDDAGHLPLLREAGRLFTPEALAAVAGAAGVPDALAWAGPNPAPLDATATLAADFLGRGGKFLRPFVTLAAHDAAVVDGGGAGSHQAARAAAVAIEVFHKASLIHDDIEDADLRRYGRATLHEEAGIPTAINTGDALVGLGYRIASSLPGVDAACRADVVAMLADAHVRLARGQGAELWWRDAADKALSVADALEIYALKTSPAFEAAVAVGVRLAGVSPETAAPLAAYARHVGVGFQILNDLKDWHGDEANDRSAAGDLLGGRPTLLWALARQRVPAADLDRLSTAARSAAASPAEAAAVIEQARLLFRGADVFGRAASIAEGERSAALEAVAACRLPRLRGVLEFLLDLALPGGAAERLTG